MHADAAQVRAFQLSALMQLDALQDEVLSRLEDLDKRIQQVLDQYLANRPKLAATEPTCEG